MKRDPLVIIAALLAALAVAAGAFGAHSANEDAAAWLRTGAAYQLPHAVAAIAVSRFNRRVSWALLVGGVIFAGTLYAMAFGAPRWFGAITPVGGVTLIGAWLFLAFSHRH